MNKSVPWSIKGVGFDAREAAKDAARRSGMSVGEWLHSVIAERARETGLDYDDIDAEEQIEAVTARLARMSEAEAPAQRRPARAARRSPAREVRYDEAEQDFDDREEAPVRRRRGDLRRSHEGQAEDTPSRGRATRSRPNEAPADDLLDHAVQIFERRHRDHALRTDQALGKVASRLAEIESHISSRDEPEHARGLRLAMESLEARVEHLARSKDKSGKVDQALEDIEGQLARLAERLPREAAKPHNPDGGEHMRRIEDKLNRLLSSLEAPTEVVFPAGRPAPSGATAEAVSEIVRRQRALDGVAADARRPARLPAAGDALTTPVYASAPQRGGRDDFQMSLQNGISHLAEKVDHLRRETRDSMASHPDITFLRLQLGEISEAVRSLAQRGSSDALERAIQDLSQRIDESRRIGVDSQSLQPIEQILAEIRKSVELSGPNRIVDDVQAELGRLHAKIDAMAAHGFDRNAFEALKRKTDEIAHVLSQVLARPIPIEGLERQVALLTERVEELAARADNVSPYLVETLDSIRASIDRLDSNPTLRDVEARVSDLANRTGDLPPYLVDMLEDMRRSIDSVAANPALRAVQKQVTDLASRSGDLPPQLIDMLAELQHSIEKMSANPALRAIEAQVAELAARSCSLPDHLVDTLQDIRISIDRMAANAGVSALQTGLGALTPSSAGLAEQLAETLDQMRVSIDRMSEQPGLRSIEAQVADLARKIDGALTMPRAASSESATESQKIYSRISDLHDALIQRLDLTAAQAASPVVEGKIADLSHRIDDVHRAVVRQSETLSQPAAPDDRLQDMVAQLAERIDRISSGQGDTRALQALENQIMRLSERLDRSGETAESIGALERAMTDLFTQLEETRHVAVDAAEAAAREAVRQSATTGLANGLAPDLIVREISELRTLQDESDRRTHSTLTAVHETLEKVVDRLALLEDDLGEMRSMDAAQDEPLAAGEPPVFERARSTPERDQPAPAVREPDMPRPAADRLPPATMPLIASGHSGMREADLAASEPHADAPDVLIEPGSGFAPRRGGDRSTAPDQPAASQPATSHQDASLAMGDEPRAAQASFIAAARRAAQTAIPGDAPELGQATERMSASVENALSEARSRARAAAASFERQKGKDGAAGLFKGKTRPLLLSIAGLFLLLGALQIARTVTDTSPNEPEQVEPLPKLSGSAPVDVDKQAQAAPAVEPAPVVTPVPEKSVQAAPAVTGATVSPGVDGMVVSAIPVQQPSIASLTSLATAGNVAAQYELASRFADGREAKRDPALAATWFRKAAEKNHAPSQYRLGALYEKGLGVTKSATDAGQWYRKAANSGNVRAMHNLAVLIADGIEGKPDYAQAAAWFGKAAEHGVRDSQYNLAILYARGLGVEQDMMKSYLWFALAATQGDADAAKKRDEIGARLDPRKLAEAKVAADTFEIRKPSAAANETASIEQLLNAPRADVAPPSRTTPGPSSSSKTTARVSAL